MSTTDESLSDVTLTNGAAMHDPATNGVAPAPGVSTGAVLGPDELLHALQAMQVGDFSVRMPGSETGILGKIADTFNEIVAANERMAQQLERVGQRVGKEGKTRQRVHFGSSTGAWGEIGRASCRERV